MIMPMRERIRTTVFSEQVARGLALVPDRLLERIGPVSFFEGCPYFAGVFSPAWSSMEALADHTAQYKAERAAGKRKSLRYMAAWSPLHQRWRPADDRCSMIEFCPDDGDPYAPPNSIVHELGHCLMFALGSYEDWPWPFTSIIGLPPVPRGLTSYMPDSYVEQFAEAFSIHHMPRERIRGRYKGCPERLYRDNPRLVGLFNELAGLPADTPPRSLR